jgi:hypothetical protein
VEAMKSKKNRISDREFERKFNKMLDEHLSKLDPKERSERVRKAHQTALKVCRTTPAICSRSEETPAIHLAARNHEE